MIESALDTGVLDLPTPLTGGRAAAAVRRHPNFRLLATQNPATGRFHGKRQQLSESLLSRFSVAPFEEMSQQEMQVRGAGSTSSVSGDTDDVGRLDTQGDGDSTLKVMVIQPQDPMYALWYP